MDLLPKVELDLLEEDMDGNDLPEGGMTYEVPDEDNITVEITEPQSGSPEPDEPPVEMRPRVPHDRIFKGPAVMEVAPPPKKKRVATEKQKEHLARCREKALASRRAKAQEKKEGKKKVDREVVENESSIPEEMKESLRKKAIEPTPRSNEAQASGFSQEQLDYAVERALQKSDADRKVRKQKKMLQRQKEEQDRKTVEVITKAVHKSNPEDDLWASCFSSA